MIAYIATCIYTLHHTYAHMRLCMLLRMYGSPYGTHTVECIDSCLRKGIYIQCLHSSSIYTVCRMTIYVSCYLYSFLWLCCSLVVICCRTWYGIAAMNDCCISAWTHARIVRMCACVYIYVYVRVILPFHVRKNGNNRSRYIFLKRTKRRLRNTWCCSRRYWIITI